MYYGERKYKRNIDMNTIFSSLSCAESSEVL